MNRLTLLLMLALLPWAASAKQTDETHGGLRFDVEWMHPMRGASSSVPWGYYVELNLDSAWVYLPYRGEAHEPTTDDDGLNFGRPVAVKDLRISMKDTKKGLHYRELTFRCRRNMAWYAFRIRLFPEGQARIDVRPQHADAISFDARYEEP